VASDAAPTLTEIALSAGLSSSRTRRFLTGLSQAGLVVQDQNSGSYSLGETMLNLTSTALRRMDPIGRGIEALSCLTERTGLVSLLSTWGSHGPTIVKWERGRLKTAVWIREGSTLPVLTTATGRLFLAFMPDKEISDLVEQELVHQSIVPSDVTCGMSDVQALREDVRRRGLSRMIGEDPGGFVAMAAPVFDHKGRLVMAITQLGIIGGMDSDYEGFAARELRATADRLSRRLGASVRQHHYMQKEQTIKTMD
jgi:DNA-binding IclR family transcriptional regulator